MSSDSDRSDRSDAGREADRSTERDSDLDDGDDREQASDESAVEEPLGGRSGPGDRSDGGGTESSEEATVAEHSTGTDADSETIGEKAINDEVTDGAVDEDADDGSTPRWRTGGSGPDRSVLNRAAIRRFAEGVLLTYGGKVRRESNARWSVRLPDGLAAELGSERATFVFEGADRTAGDTLVAPGTRTFNALCAFAREPASASTSDAGSAKTAEMPGADEESDAGYGTGPAGHVGTIHLGSDVLQLHSPPVLDAAGFETSIEGFSPRGTERALAFHFRAQFLSVRSYQREESVTIAVDPATRSALPALAARLRAHSLRLLDPRDDGGDHDGEDRDEEGQGNGGCNADSKSSEADTGFEFDRETVLGAYSTVKTAAIEAIEPTAEALRKREEAAVTERITEISEYYDRQRAELDETVDAKRADIKAYAEKYDRAQGDETRLRYLREQREAEDELATLTERVEARKCELRDEERARISEETDRHRVDVDLDLVRATELSYERGTLELSVTDGEVTARPTVSYVPATDECYGLDCVCCGTDLAIDAESEVGSSADGDTDSDVGSDRERPRLCAGGHLVCKTCARTCRTCGETRCLSCLDAAGTAEGPPLEPGTDSTVVTEAETGVEPGSESEVTVESFEACALCREPVCTGCAIVCDRCGKSVCRDHRSICDACEAATCLFCGEPCAACGTFHCDAHLVEPDPPGGAGETGVVSATSDTGGASEAGGLDLYCEAHVMSCTECGERRGIDAIDTCGECDAPLCEAHELDCAVCNGVRCSDHAVRCAFCVDSADSGEAGESKDPGDDPGVATFCADHTERCVGGNEAVCETHSQPGVIVDDWICDEHRVACELCGVRYAESGFEAGRCPACAGLDAETPAEPPVAAVAAEFSAPQIGTTPTHAVIRGKKRLRRDEIVVVDRRTGEEVRRFKADFFGNLSGGAP